MGGAYTSKPDATTAVDVPPDWNPEWTHPGPWPPGYTPTLTIVSTGAATIAYNGSINAISTLYDNDSYKTTDPGESLTYSATMNGAVVGMRWSGGSTYYTTLTQVFADLGSGFYGNDRTIEFDLEESDEERSVIVTIAGTPFDQSVSDTVIATIEAASGTIRFYGTVTYSTGQGVPNVYVSVNYYVPPFGFPVNKNTVTDENGEWEVEHDYVEGNLYSVSAWAQSGSDALLDQDSFSLFAQDPVDDEDEEVNLQYAQFASGATLVMSVSGSSPGVDEANIGRLNSSGGSNSAEMELIQSNSGWTPDDTYWTMVHDPDGTGTVTVDYDAYNASMNGGGNLSLYAYCTTGGSTTTSATVTVELNDGNGSQVFSDSVVGTDPGGGGGNTLQWLTFDETGGTEI